jgi:hypothetical protein
MLGAEPILVHRVLDPASCPRCCRMASIAIYVGLLLVKPRMTNFEEIGSSSRIITTVLRNAADFLRAQTSCPPLGNAPQHPSTGSTAGGSLEMPSLHSHLWSRKLSRPADGQTAAAGESVDRGVTDFPGFPERRH